MKKCSLDIVEEEIYAKRKTVRYDIRDLTVEAISKKYEDGLEEGEETKSRYNYMYIPEYQRDFTWDEDRQSKLIESIILGLPIPFIFVAENKKSSWEIVDGSQRVRTINAFLNDNLVLNNLSSIKSLNGYKFSELDKMLFVTLSTSNYPKILQIKRRYGIIHSDKKYVRLFYPVPSYVIIT